MIREKRAWIATAARAGFAAQALVYGTIGVLAARYALGVGGRATDSRGAIIEFSTGTLGTVLLVPMALGFFGYALWRFVQAVADTEDKGRELKGIALRVGYFFAGIINGWLGVLATRLLVGERLVDGESAPGWTARILSADYGSELLVVAGIGVIVFGLAQFHRAFSNEYREHLETGRMDSRERTLAEKVSKLGLSTRGTIYALAGIFLIIAALTSDPSEAHDPGGVLATVADKPLLLGTLALGLLAYGMYAAFEAVYRRI